MNTTVLPAALGILLVCLAAPADAIPRTFVSGTGGGVICTRAAPCADLQSAHDVTDSGGEVTCLDGGNFAGASIVTINKSITIDCGGGSVGTVFASAAQGFLINTAGVIVRLRNLTIHGGGGSSTGIRFTAGASLFVEKCLITNFTDTNARGISFAPTSGASTLFVSDTTITNNNEPSTGLGIAIEVVPSGTASVRTAFDRLRAENNRQGILVSAASGQTTQVQLHDSFVANNLTNGLNVLGSGGTAVVVVDRTSIMYNGSNGVIANGANARIFVGSSSIIGNNAGFATSAGGLLFSFQNNQVINVIDNPPTVVLPLN